MKTGVPRGRHLVRSLLREVNRFDRRLAGFELDVQFASIAERDGVEDKLVAKWAFLVQMPMPLVSGGVKFNLSALRQSFGTPADTVAAS